MVCTVPYGPWAMENKFPMGHGAYGAFSKYVFSMTHGAYDAVQSMGHGV